MSDRSGDGFQIYTMKADGSDLVRITYGAGDDHDPTWSPHGRLLAYAGTEGIQVIDVHTEVVHEATGEGFARAPSFSHDGNRIAFSNGPDPREGAPQILEITWRQDVLDELTHIPGGAAHPSFSPNGRRIAFVATNSAALWLMDANGRRQHRVMKGGAVSSPTWSIDGRWIVFARGSGVRSIWGVHPDGTGLHRIVSVPGLSLDHPSWEHLS